MDFRFNAEAYRNSVAHWQEKRQGDNHTIILAAMDRKTRTLYAKYGVFKGQKVQLVTIRPLISAGWDRMKNRTVFSVIGINQPVLAANEWLGYNWLEDIERRSKGILPDGFPYAVRRFLLEGNEFDSTLASPKVYRWLSNLCGRLSLTPGDAAEREAARLLLLAEGKNEQFAVLADNMELEVAA